MADAKLAQPQQSVFDLMSQTLASWGLGTLAADLKKFIVAGDSAPDTLALALSQTAAYKQRFVGNDARQKAGLPALTPAQYIATEEQYNNLLRQYGTPAGFYDTPSDFTNFIANDVSPTELESRLKDAQSTFMNAPQEYKDAWRSYYGLTDGDAIASLLDPTHASVQDIHNQAQAVAIGGTAAQQGLGINRQRAEQFQQQGVTLQQAQQAYQSIAQNLSTDQAIAGRFGQTFGQTQEENDLLLGQGDATAQRRALYGAEQGLFGGHSGADQSSLASSTAGV